MRRCKESGIEVFDVFVEGLTGGTTALVYFWVFVLGTALAEAMRVRYPQTDQVSDGHRIMLSVLEGCYVVDEGTYISFLLY